MGRILAFPDVVGASRQADPAPERTAELALPKDQPASVVMAVAECLEAILAKLDPLIDKVDQLEAQQLLRWKIESARLEIRVARHNALLLEAALDA